MELSDIQTEIDNGKLFYLQQLAAQLILLKKGCGSLRPFYSLQRLIRGLTFQYNAAVVDDTTLTLYKCLLTALGGYSSPYTPDTGVIIPGTTYIIQNPAAYLPWVDILWGAMSSTDGIDGNGGRSIYYQPLWVGVKPALQTPGVVMLTYPNDYSLVPSGGFALSPTGNLPYIYDGGFIRAQSFDFVNGAPTPAPRDPIIFPDPSGQPSLSAAYLNATYQYPAFQEGDIITLAAANQQYQRQDNNNPSTWNNSPFNYA